MSGRRARLVGLVAVVVGLTGCSVPAQGEPTRIAAADVPYGLASPTPSAPDGSATDSALTEAGIYLVSAQDVLQPQGRELPDGDLQERLQALLRQLAAGPSAQERADELSTALPPEVELQVTDITDGSVTVDFAGSVDAPTGEESRLAVAQIVLTATSVPGVREVRLTRQGEPIDAPLPNGELTSAPLTAADFAAFLLPRTTLVPPLPESAPLETPAPAPQPPASPTSAAPELESPTPTAPS